MVALNLGIQMFLLMSAGFILCKLKVLPKDFDRGLTKLILCFTLPCLIIKSLCIDFDPAQLKEVFTTLLVSLLCIVLLFIMGQVSYLLCGKGAIGRVARFGTIFSNYTFVGMPVVEAFYGAHGLFLFTIFTLPVRLVFYVSPQFLLKSREDAHSEKMTAAQRIKGFFSAPVVAVFIGLFFYFTGLRLPAIVNKTIASAASVCSPLGMMICGMFLARLDVKNVLKSPRIFICVLMRLIVAPTVVLLVLKLIGIEHDLLCVAVSFAGLPCASLLPSFAMQHANDDISAPMGSVAVFVSTILGIATLPIWATILG